MIDLNISDKCLICNNSFINGVYSYIYSYAGYNIKYESDVLKCDICNYALKLSVMRPGAVNELIFNFKDAGNSVFIYNTKNITYMRISGMSEDICFGKNIFPISIDDLKKIIRNATLLN